MTRNEIRNLTRAFALLICVAVPVWGQTGGDTAKMAGMADHVMSGPMDENMMKHMHLTPPRTPTHADSVRATKIVAELKQAIAKYQDTAAAVADGYKMFLPGVKNQRVFHFTNNGRALLSAFHFDPSKPTSVLYKRGDGWQAPPRRRDVHMSRRTRALPDSTSGCRSGLPAGMST